MKRCGNPHRPSKRTLPSKRWAPRRLSCFLFTLISISFTAGEIANRVQGEVEGDADTLLTGLAAADAAGCGDLTFAEKGAHFQAAAQSAASGILVAGPFRSPEKVLIRVRDARVAFARLLPLFFPEEQYPAGIHPSVVTASSAEVHPTAHIGPGCVIGEGACIGARSVLVGGNHLGKNVHLGEDVRLFPNVVVYDQTLIGNRVTIHAGTVIGADGFGYVFDQGVHRKIQQVGKVVIEDDVEIGANSAIDRGALGSTVIGAGTKIDNLVHIAHNVVLGRHCLIMGQVGFAGSTRLGDYVVVASQSGIAGHLHLGDQATIGAKSGVMRDVPAGGTVLGIPAMSDKQTKRQWIGVQQLPETTRRIRELEHLVGRLTARLDALEASSPEPDQRSA
ncbi:UDP-3-O-(3-hydroxymyristoyl) glucosamine N-acyltransferase [Chthoniobacter flavus Ellin428]|uniref:UDP-3-O-acylglucosamine N-acyltransferase n=1 Tax=Chthoniobacter flavus Ellin428 TaxID=497964 RepID=B4D3P3_9BACT|nr:UDP-3-O-(3-hydroxymyristoyl)glucosamine N-acyltransferase [Chthoniobacter flavus]EDY18873.1 UDP-3-O-(3-hydroxymyristoyl) glucosamine N-acyltransferase [Chthoniobacter flavus Ellin428]TCO93464.1 UDP-3-O-[3-hydroxymyristoyl] glucosamine N-acyltransferase [Chthoniobacter flavus]